MATETFIIDIRTRGTKRSAADVKRIGTSASQVRKTLAFLRAALVAVAAVRVFATLTSDLVAFSDQMLVVKAVTNATTAEFVRLREVAKGLGATTRFTATEAAEGMAFLARAGFDVNEVIGAIPGVLDLAAAAQLDLGNAADIASNLMTSFGLAVSDIPEIMDTLVFTANNANTTVQQLADGLKLVAPIISQLGISLKDAAAFMAVLGDAGIQASLAGTGFRRVVTDMETPTGTFAKVLRKLGIEFDEIRPSVVGLQAGLQRLTEANLGASIASALFGKRGGFVAAQMLRAAGDAEEFRKLLEDIEREASRTAKEMESGLGGALRLVRSALKDLFLSFAGLGAEDFLNQFFRDLAEGLRVVARNVDIVVSALKVLLFTFIAFKAVAIGAAFVVAAATMASYTVGTLAAAFSTGTLTGAVAILGGALLALPFVAILTTLTLLTAGLVVFQDEIKLTDDGTITLADTFTALENTVGETLLDAINSLGGEFENFGDIVDTIATRVGLGFTRLVANLNGVVEVIKAIFNEFPKFFTNLGTEIQRLFFQTLQDGLNGLVNGFNELFKVLSSDLQFGLFDLGTLIPETTSLGVDLKAAFNKGFDAVGTELFKASDVRRADERERAFREALLAARRADQARIVSQKEEIDAGATLESILGDPDVEKAAKEIERLTEALQDLEAAHFPLIARQDDLAKTMAIINDAADKGITLRVNEAQLLRRVARERIGANITLKQAQEEQKALRIELVKTNISMEEFEFLSRKSAISFLEGQRDSASGAQRAFLKLQQDATDSAAVTERAFTDAFKAIEDAVVDFATTGELSVNSFFRNFAEQLLRLGVQQAIVGIGSAFPGFGASTGASGGQAGIGGLVASLVGSFLPGFHEGGAFKVGASSAAASLPGIDNRLVAFRARDGEEVSVTPKNQIAQGGSAAGATNIVFNIETKDADSFNRSQSQLQNRLLAGIGQARRRR